jgi:F0F1-type ATP synthase alpha subunit
VKDFQTKLSDYLTTRQDAILGQIRDKAAISDDLAAQLKSSITTFAETYA